MKKKQVGWLPLEERSPTPDPQPKIALDIDFTAFLLVTDRDFLYQEYVTKGKSTKFIARELGCARSTVSAYLYEHGIAVRESPLSGQRRGQIAFGEKLRNGLIVPHLGEQEVISKLQALRREGASFSKLVAWLTENEVRTKNGAIKWDRPTLYKILKRAADFDKNSEATESLGM